MFACDSCKRTCAESTAGNFISLSDCKSNCSGHVFANDLNNMMNCNGVLLRHLYDGFQGERDSSRRVAPTTLWHADLSAPNTLNNLFPLPSNLDMANVAMAYSRQGMEKMFYQYNTMMSDTAWNYGAFYATDSNSAGQRGRTMVSNKMARVPTVPSQCNQTDNCIAIPRGDASESPPGYITWDDGQDVKFAPWDGNGLELDQQGVAMG